ncbi:MAG: hypothetical protein ACREJ2_06030 [Planctomycetota bacterium]
MSAPPPPPTAPASPTAPSPPPFEPLDERFATPVELEAALRAVTPLIFPPGRPDEPPLYTVRASRCQFRNGAELVPDADGELLPDEDGAYAYSLPQFKWICTIGGNADFAAKGSAEDRFPSLDALIAAVLPRVRKMPPWEFWEACGDGFDAAFTPADGRVELGYRLSTTQDRNGVVLLHLSLCHRRIPAPPEPA